MTVVQAALVYHRSVGGPVSAVPGIEAVVQSFVEFIAGSFDSDVPVNWKRKSLSHAVAAFRTLRRAKPSRWKE